MGTRADLFAFLRSHTATDATRLPDGECDEMINSTVERMQQAHDWTPQETILGVTYTALADGLVLPADFIAEYDVYEKDLTQSDPSRALTPLTKCSRRQWIARANAPDVNRSHPRPPVDGRHYYIWSRTLFVVPQPTADLALVLDYHAQLAEVGPLNTANFFTTRYFRCVRWGALAEAYLFLHEWDAAEKANGIFADRLTSAIKQDSSLRMSGAPKTRGG